MDIVCYVCLSFVAILYFVRIKITEKENRELKYKIVKYANINEQDTKDNAVLYNKIENIEEYCQDIINTSHVNDNDKYIAENIMQIIRGEN